MIQLPELIFKTVEFLVVVKFCAALFEVISVT